VDATSRAPLPGAQLHGTNQVVDATDQNGVVAFYEPGLMDTDVYFSVTRQGYELPADLFGNRGKALHPQEGGSGEIAMNYLAAATVPAQGDLQSRLLLHPVPGPKESCAIYGGRPGEGPGRSLMGRAQYPPSTNHRAVLPSLRTARLKRFTTPSRPWIS
jgi:hypothetical protein